MKDLAIDSPVSACMREDDVRWFEVLGNVPFGTLCHRCGMACQSQVPSTAGDLMKGTLAVAEQVLKDSGNAGDPHLCSVFVLALLSGSS